MRGVRGMMPHLRRAVALGSLTQGSLSARSLLMLAAVVALLIAGLLGMHVLGGSAGSHGAHGAGPGSAAIGAAVEHAPDGAAAAHAHAAEAASAAKAAPCLGDCVDAPLAPGHAELMACVLALLAGLIVLVPPGSLGRSWMRVAMLPAPSDASAVLLVPPPPSLTLLSISRT